jgi:glycosyltransferase involved in cell wall biosynthesis
MRLLLHSNGPNVTTGYGVQAAQFLINAAADGHDVACSCTYGQQGSMGRWNDIPLYPNGYEVHGNDVIHNHALDWFGGDERAGWIVTLLDVWALQNPLLKDFKVAAWCPVDHYPVPPGVLAFFDRTGAVPIAMSRFGERLLFDAGLDPLYVPLAVDTSKYRPTFIVGEGDLKLTGRQIIGAPDDAFVVGMVAMNKGWARDRKGFNEAFRAFAEFRRRHPNAVLYVHSEQHGAAEGIDLVELAKHAGVPPEALLWVSQYDYRRGYPPEIMAAVYTAMDVLLSPSHGEGFCVPLIEAQACGTPVIASGFSSQKELASPEYGAAGWLVEGQPEWDPAQKATYICPFIGSVVECLEQAYAADLPAMAERAVAFASQYDTKRVWENYWRPALAQLDPPPRQKRDAIKDIAVVVPCVRDEDNAKRLRASFDATNDGTAKLYIGETGEPTRSYAQNVNALVARSTESWVAVVGDDCEFTPGWIEAARAASEYADVVGTNDSEPGRVRNPEVAAGNHADHFLVRRSYIDELGASLDGPGTLAPEAYGHWFTDKEIIGLAQARDVFTFAPECRIIHHHPGYDGREDKRRGDPVYMTAVARGAADAQTYQQRLPLIKMQRVGRS